MSDSPSRYSITKVPSSNDKLTTRRKLPYQVLIVFLLLILFGICLHCLTTYWFPPGRISEIRLLSTNPPVTRIPFIVQDGPWDDPNLLNITNFEYVRNNDSICRDKHITDDVNNLESHLLLIMVTSARENYNERCAIRKAVQKMAATVSSTNNEWTVCVVFLLGMAYDPQNSGEKDALLMEESFLSEEHAVYGDMIVGNFIDSFDNLTYKTMMGLKWALEYCQNAKFVIKINDDAFFNIPKFVQWRNEEMRDAPNVPDLYCIPAVGIEPTRVPSGKGNRLLVSKSEWPANTFPNFCQGIMYGMSVNLLAKMYKVSTELSYFRLEDIFVTGVVMERVEEQYGKVHRREVVIGQESEQTLRTICDKKVMRQTISEDIGLAVELKRDTFMEKQMLCLAREV